MNNDLTVFENSQFGQVRIVEIDGEPWFIASDIAKALGYERPNDAVNTHCKKVNKFSYGDSPQPYNIIPESDVYRLIMRSNLPKAEEFQAWVVEEVLPAIRKTGGYKQPAPRRSSDDLNARSTATTLRMMARLKCYPEEMKGVFLAQAAHLTSGLPLAGLLPHVPDDRDRWLSPTAIGEHFGISANAVGRILKAEGLHGQNDPEHAHSQPLSDKSPYSDKQVISYVYDPAVVIPAIEAVLSRPSGVATQ